MSKIVVTSLGAFHSQAASAEALLRTLSYSRTRSATDTVASETVDEVILRYLDSNEVRRIDKVSKMTLISGLSCLEQVKFGNFDAFKSEIGVVANTCFGAMSCSKEFINTALEKGDKNASPIIFPYTVPNAATGSLTIKLGVNGFNTTLSGYNPVGYAFDLLNLERASGLFVLGFDEVTEFITDIKMKGNIFFNGDYSEGSVTLFMTTADFAKQLGQPHLFEVCGFSSFYNNATEDSF